MVISTGAYRFPRQDAARIAVEAVRNALTNNPRPQRVVFCCFSDGDARIYERILGR